MSSAVLLWDCWRFEYPVDPRGGGLPESEGAFFHAMAARVRLEKRVECQNAMAGTANIG